MAGLFGGRTPAIRGPRAVARLEALQLGGVKQWVVIRGHDTNNPLLVYLHGGPGGSDYNQLRTWNGVLEERFTLVHWIQRGANKSYSKSIPPESMTIAQLLADLHELIVLVTRRFGQQKVFLVGQSIGTALGMLYIQQHPDMVHAYVGVNQVVDRSEEEAISYADTLEAARRVGSQKAVKALEQLGAPERGAFASGIMGIIKQRQWLSTLGLLTHNPARAGEWQKRMLFAPELYWGEQIRLYFGLKWSMTVLWPQYCRLNLREEVPAVQVPVYFVAARHDHITNLALTEQYFAQLQAPKKVLTVFEESGHLALFEEPERFNRLMIDVVRTDATAPGEVPA